ncbi:kinase-like domain-containing protein [Mycena polygramma]|nr:kinase-like domain-containing protein [Mycena polygramma]
MVLPSGAKYLKELPDSMPIPPLPYFNKYWEPPSPFTPAPPTLEGWERRNDISPATPILLTDLEAHGYKISSVCMLGSGIFHMVYILTLDDGSEILSRISFNFKSDTPSHRLWAEKKMEREIAVLKLLDRNALVPRVLYASPSTENSIASPYMLLQRLPGAPFGKEAHSITTMSEKERFVASIAAAFVQVFEVSLPAIGTVVNVNPDGRPIMGPLVDVGETDHIVAEGPFDTVDRYLDAMITLAKVRNTLCPLDRGPTAEDPDLPSLLDRLRALADLLIPTDDAASPRIALVHSDANADNMLMHNGVISGLIDWEKSAALPTYLAARCPPFLRSDGIWDPRYAARAQAMYRYPSEWPATEEERKHLRAVFQESAGKLNMEFTHALEQGEMLRQLVEWVEFSAWSGQTTWNGCDHWERDTRAALGRQLR